MGSRSDAHLRRRSPVFAREPGGQEVWPFDAPQHLILNVAVGGTWGGREGVDDAALPFRFEMDYVRVYAG
jgi:hypothetical protein